MVDTSLVSYGKHQFETKERVQNPHHHIVCAAHETVADFLDVGAQAVHQIILSLGYTCRFGGWNGEQDARAQQRFSWKVRGFEFWHFCDRIAGDYFDQNHSERKNIKCWRHDFGRERGQPPPLLFFSGIQILQQFGRLIFQDCRLQFLHIFKSDSIWEIFDSELFDDTIWFVFILTNNIIGAQITMDSPWMP